MSDEQREKPMTEADLDKLDRDDLLAFAKREAAENATLRRKNEEALKKSSRLGLNFETPNNQRALGKEKWDENIAHVVRDNIPYLVKREEKSVLTDDSENAVTHTLIKGDNFPALLTLLPEYRNSVDVIYLDPPYNTGSKDFIYNDQYVDKENKYRHSRWLRFMARRLLLAREMMSETGTIMVSIDDNEYAHLRMLMDDIFGAENFMSSIIWDGGLKNNSRFVSVGHDYMLIYAKSKSALIEKDVSWREEKRGMGLFKTFIEELTAEDSSMQEKQKRLRAWLRENRSELDKGLQAYSNIDEVGVWASDNISAPGGQGARYEITHPITRLPCKAASGGWRFSRKSFEEKYDAGLIAFGKDHTSVPRFKRLLIDGNNESQVARSYFWDERSNSNKALQKILGYGVFDFPKSVDVMKRWINLVSANNTSATVLDFFAGSGTTGQAVAELNSEDGGNRRCILVTDAGKTGNANNEDMSGENGETDIAEDITHERMKRVITGEDWADPKKAYATGGNLEMFEVEFLPTTVSSATEDGASVELTALEILMKLEDRFTDMGYDEETAESLAQKLYNRWRKFSEDKKGDLARWD